MIEWRQWHNEPTIGDLRCIGWLYAIIGRPVRPRWEPAPLPARKAWQFS